MLIRTWLRPCKGDIGRHTTVGPPNTADLGTDEKAAIFGNQRYWESYITYKTLIWDLEMGGVIGGDDCTTTARSNYLTFRLFLLKKFNKS